MVSVLKRGYGEGGVYYVEEPEKLFYLMKNNDNIQKYSHDTCPSTFTLDPIDLVMVSNKYDAIRKLTVI